MWKKSILSTLVPAIVGSSVVHKTGETTHTQESVQRQLATIGIQTTLTTHVLKKVKLGTLSLPVNKIEQVESTEDKKRHRLPSRIKIYFKKNVLQLLLTVNKTLAHHGPKPGKEVLGPTSDMLIAQVCALYHIPIRMNDQDQITQMFWGGVWRNDVERHLYIKMAAEKKKGFTYYVRFETSARVWELVVPVGKKQEGTSCWIEKTQIRCRPL